MFNSKKKNNKGQANDVGVKEKYKEIPSQNIVMHKSGPMQKES